MAEAKLTMLLDTLREINALVSNGVMDKESAQLLCKFAMRTLITADHDVIDLNKDNAVSESEDDSDHELLAKMKTSKRKADESGQEGTLTKKRGPGRPPKKQSAKITTSHGDSS